MRLTCLLLSLILFVGAKSNSYAIDSDPEKIDITLIVNNQVKGVTLIDRLPGKDNFHFPGPLVLMALSDILSEKDVAMLDKSMAAKGYLSSDELRKLGLEVGFNSNKAEVVINAKVYGKPPSANKLSSNANPDSIREYLPKSAYRQDTLTAGLNDSLILKNSESQLESHNSKKRKPVPDPNTTLSAPPTPTQVAEKSGSPVTSQKGVDTVPTPEVKVSPPKPDTVTKNPIINSFAFPESKDALFEKVFKSKPPKRPEKIELSLYVDDEFWGKVWIKLTKDESDFFIPSDTLVTILEEKISPESLKKLKLITSKSGFITGKALLEQGIIPTLKLDIFDLHLQIPSQLLGTQKHNLSPYLNDDSPLNDYPSAIFSGYLNTRARQRLQYYQLSPNAVLTNTIQDPLQNKNDNTRAPAVFDFDGALNFKSVVLESRAVYTEPDYFQDSYFTRDDIRFIYDQPSRTTRYAAGDLLFPTFGYQSFLKMGGIGASRDFSLRPNQIVYPTKDYEFFLENEAEVKVYVNGSLVSTLLLKPGPQNLQNFPVAAGVSEIQIDILDVTGRTQSVKFNFIFEPSLLAKGKSAFSYNIGFASEFSPDQNNWKSDSNNFDFLGYRYRKDKLATSVAYQRGITNRWTAAAYSQTLGASGLGGINSLLAFPLGKVNFDFAFSQFDSLGTDIATKISYSYVPKPGVKNSNPIGWIAQVEYLGKNFSHVQLFPYASGNAFIFSSGITKALEQVSLSLTGGYTMRWEKSNVYNASLGIRRQIMKGFSGSANINHFFNNKDIATTTFSADFQYNFSSGPNTFNANQRAITHRADLQTANQNQIPLPNQAPGQPLSPVTTLENPPQWDNTTDLTWDYNNAAPFPENPKVSGMVSLGPTDNDYSGKINLRGNQGFLDVDARRIEPAAGYGNFVQNQLDFTLQTSFVFADGFFGISRPVQNGFLLTTGIKSLKSTDVVINPNDAAGYDAQSNYISPAVLPSLFPYSPKTVKVNLIDPPIGTSLEKTQFNLFPGYKCGYLITLGTDGDVVAMGTFNDRVGKPLEYKVLKIYSLDDPKAPAFTAFTNASGRFQVAAVKAGKWKLEALDIGSTTFTVPKKTVGLYQLGELKMDPEK